MPLKMGYAAVPGDGAEAQPVNLMHEMYNVPP